MQLPVIFRGKHQHLQVPCHAYHACHAFLSSILGAVMVEMFSFGKTMDFSRSFLVFIYIYMIRPVNPLGLGPQLDIAELQEVRLQDVLDRQEVWGRNEWTNCSENF